MAKVEIYTTPLCGFCYRAKGLLESKAETTENGTEIAFKPTE